MPIEVCVASCQNRFIGYWGYGNPAMLAQQLQGLTGADWDLSSQPGTDGILISLSAAGLPPDDVWVRVNANCLSLGREAFGRVTLYWLRIDRIVWFASQLQLLLPLVELPQVSIPALYGYSCCSYVPTPFTPVAEIAAVAAGTEQVWQADGAGEITTASIVNLIEWAESSNQTSDEQAATATLQTLLIAAVDRQIADLQGETVGVFLSGGLDSSIVAALLVRAGVKVRAYTLDFGAEGISEYPYGLQVAEYLNIPLVKVDATSRSIDRALIATIKALDLPFGDGVTVPLYLLNQAASRDVSIVFNGEGGDQLFAGWTNKPLIAASVYQSVHPECETSFTDRYLRTFHRLWGYEAQVFQPELHTQIKDLHPEDWLTDALDETYARAAIHRLRRASLMLKGAQNIQPRATNLAFAHGLQVRSIFCDRELTAWTFQVAGSLYLQGACEKYILKRAVEDWLPSEIVWRQKRGMGVPLTSWCLNQWWRSIGRWLNPGILEAEGCWRSDLAATVALGDLGFQGRRIGEILWLLTVWQLWREHVLGTSVGIRSWNHPFWLPHQIWQKIRSVD
jgi:asparagine synthase (glutamine-hydrolysing)